MASCATLGRCREGEPPEPPGGGCRKTGRGCAETSGAGRAKLSVHLLHQPGPEARDHLLDHLDATIRATFGVDLPEPADFHVLVAGRPQREHLVASANLRALIIPWAGLPETTRDMMQDFPGVAVHNLHHNALAVAEMAVGLLLAAAKGLIPADRALRAHDWTPLYEQQRPVLLDGGTALILGYGAIGREVARLCRALGMKVIATRRRATAADTGAADEVHPPDALHSLLPRATVLIICLPHTPETNGLIGERELALLPPHAILVNVGRGRIVAEEALYQALETGGVRGAGLDVWYSYPADEAARSCTPASAYPFHELDSVVMSPHRVGHAAPIERTRMEHLAASVNAAARGESIPHRVDLDAGY